MLSSLASDAWVIRLLVYVDRASRYLLDPSAYSTPSAREDLPEPDTPATATTFPNGTSTSTDFRLWTLAPRISTWSGAERLMLSLPSIPAPNTGMAEQGLRHTNSSC